MSNAVSERIRGIWIYLLCQYLFASPTEITQLLGKPRGDWKPTTKSKTMSKEPSVDHKQGIVLLARYLYPTVCRIWIQCIPQYAPTKVRIILFYFKTLIHQAIFPYLNQVCSISNQSISLSNNIYNYWKHLI